MSGSQITPCERFLDGKQRQHVPQLATAGAVVTPVAAAAARAPDAGGDHGLPLNVLLAVAVAVLALVVGMMAIR